MKYAVKWMYSVDQELTKPYDQRLSVLMDSGDFRDIIGADPWERMKLIRVLGNSAAHTGKKITLEQAMLCLENM